MTDFFKGVCSITWNGSAATMIKSLHRQFENATFEQLIGGQFDNTKRPLGGTELDKLGEPHCYFSLLAFGDKVGQHGTKNESRFLPLGSPPIGGFPLSRQPSPHRPNNVTASDFLATVNNPFVRINDRDLYLKTRVDATSFRLRFVFVDLNTAFAVNDAGEPSRFSVSHAVIIPSLLNPEYVEMARRRLSDRLGMFAGAADG